ncbi:TPA: helix-turn-helix domain-containing protein [Clostridioides difficile]
MDVTQRIIELRDKKGYSTNKLATKAGLTQSTLQSILSGRN